MSKYFTEEFPNETNRFEIFVNTESLSWRQIKEKTKCKAIINLGYFHLGTFTPCSGLIVNEKVVAAPEYHSYGVCIDKNGVLTFNTEDSDVAKVNYRVAVPCMWLKGERVSHEFFDTNGTTMVGFKSNGTPVFLICGRDDGVNKSVENGLTSTEGVNILRNLGCSTVLRYDGSWSTQGYLGPDKEVQPTERRDDYDYLLVYERNPSMPKIVLDPGHSLQTPGKCSPDGVYHEQEFALDMALRMEEILKNHEVEVTLTRSTGDSITGGYSSAESNARVKLANNITDLSLYVSLHSNAESTWGSAKGWSIMTSAKDDTAERNKAAKAIKARVEEAGITLRKYPFTYNLSIIVLRKTDAPAVLIEHGFHTNKEELELLKSSEYRQKLAVAECKGILDYLGITYKENNFYDSVKKRFSFSDETMQYLLQYKYAEDLLKRLAITD